MYNNKIEYELIKDSNSEIINLENKILFQVKASIKFLRSSRVAFIIPPNFAKNKNKKCEVCQISFI